MEHEGEASREAAGGARAAFAWACWLAIGSGAAALGHQLLWTRRAMLLQNQYMLGSTMARFEQQRLGHLPLLIHSEPRTVGFIGLATGITPAGAHTPLLALVGWRDGGIDREVVARRSAERKWLKDPVLRHADGIGLLYLGRFAGSAEGVVPNTLDNMRLELAAGRRRIGSDGGAPYLAGKDRLDLRAELLAAGEAESLNGTGIDLAEAGVRLAWAAWTIRSGQPLRRSMREWLPPSILSDLAADWRQWPGPDPRFTHHGKQQAPSRERTSL